MWTQLILLYWLMTSQGFSSYSNWEFISETVNQATSWMPRILLPSAKFDRLSSGNTVFTLFTLVYFTHQLTKLFVDGKWLPRTFSISSCRFMERNQVQEAPVPALCPGGLSDLLNSLDLGWVCKKLHLRQHRYTPWVSKHARTLHQGIGVSSTRQRQAGSGALPGAQKSSRTLSYETVNQETSAKSGRHSVKTMVRVLGQGRPQLSLHQFKSGRHSDNEVQ